MSKEKIAVFIGDYFWSSIPYDCLPLHKYLSESFDTDLIMFNQDIRLRKTKDKFDGCLFKFDNKDFVRSKNLILINDWNEFYAISGNYNLILRGPHIAAKGRRPGVEFMQLIKCKNAVIDIGGSDILQSNADYYMVKGEEWVGHLMSLPFNGGIKRKPDHIFVTGTPHYDPYHVDSILGQDKPLGRKDFYTKYGLSKEKRLLLVVPSNPSAHCKQFSDNMASMNKLVKIADREGYHVAIKTYPHDYVFHEPCHQYNGVYIKWLGGSDGVKTNKSMAMYEYILKHVPGVFIVESQDHFSVMMAADRLFNMSGSHISWETFFTSATSYAVGFEGQPYYCGSERLPREVRFPDEKFNVHLKDVEDVVTSNLISDKSGLEKFILREFSLPNIKKAVERILANDR
jgi:hypothetical protein